MRSLRHLSCHVSPDHIPIMGVLLGHCVFIHVLIHPCFTYQTATEENIGWLWEKVLLLKNHDSHSVVAPWSNMYP